MPDRMIRDKIRESFSLDRCSLDAFGWWPHFVRIADNYGRFDADPRVMACDMSKRRFDIKPAFLAKCLSEYVREKMVRLYEVEGRQYAYLVTFDKYNDIAARYRSEPSKLPEPPDTPEHAGAPRFGEHVDTGLWERVMRAKTDLEEKGERVSASNVAKSLGINSGNSRVRIKQILTQTVSSPVSCPVPVHQPVPVPCPCPPPGKMEDGRWKDGKMEDGKMGAGPDGTCQSSSSSRIPIDIAEAAAELLGRPLADPDKQELVRWLYEAKFPTHWILTAIADAKRDGKHYLGNPRKRMENWRSEGKGPGSNGAVHHVRPVRGGDGYVTAPSCPDQLDLPPLEGGW